MSLLLNDFGESMNKPSLDFSFNKAKIDTKKVEDILVDLNFYKKINSNYGDKKKVIDAMYKSDYTKCRQISNFYFKASGIYARLCKYLANMYRYDWMVTAYINDDKIENDTIKKKFYQLLNLLDKFNVKKHLGQIALNVIRDGCWYGYIVRDGVELVDLQELPIEYCRSRFNIKGQPAVEFNMSYFDDMWRDTEQRIKILKLFPLDIQKGYVLYKKGKLKSEVTGEKDGWYLLDSDNAVKFNINEDDMPIFMAVIPAIIDLGEAQGLDRARMAQELQKLIIQQLPLNKEGESIFDPEEIADFHENAVRMLSGTYGLQVLTTLANTSVEAVQDSSTKTTTDDLAKVEREVFNEAGVSQLQFNSTGNIALNNSILNDEASLYNLILKFQEFLDKIILPFNKSPKKFHFRSQILSTTIYNYKEMSKMYKEEMQIGYSKMLAQIALGQSQSSILANAHFENDVLELFYVFIPPLMSSTMSSDILNTKMWDNKNGGSQSKSSTNSQDSTGGRPELEENEKSDKTLRNEAAK